MSVSTFAPRLNHGVKHMFPNLVASSAKGSYLQTECGRRFLDFSAGIGVTNLGHSHPGVTAAVQGAVGNLVHAQQNIMRHRPMINLIEKLANLDFSKSAGLDSWYFWNSGAEAVEAAVKIARQSTGRPNIIGMNLGYHGRTYGSMALTTSGTIYRAGFGPVMSGTFVAPFPYVTRGPYGRNDAPKNWPKHNTVDGYEFWGAAPREVVDMDTERCLEAIELMLRTQTAPSETAGIILEPVLGEGGYVPAPPGFMTGLRKICDKHGIMLIADEVQSGFGRTGSMFACEWIDGGIRPDILISAKGLANGYPLSAVATRSEISAKQPPGSMGGTYGANAVSCVASLAVIEAFEKENVLKQTMESEKLFRTAIKDVNQRAPGFVREIRGRGLMLAAEFNPIPGMNPGYTAGAVATACHNKDLLVMSTGPYDTIRFMPPLNIAKDDLLKGAKLFLDAVEEVHKAKRV